MSQPAYRITISIALTIGLIALVWVPLIAWSSPPAITRDRPLIEPSSPLEPGGVEATAGHARATSDQILYAVVPDGDYIAVIDPTLAVDIIDVGNVGCHYPWHMRIMPDGVHAYVTCRNSNSLAVLDLADRLPVDHIADIGFASPGDIAFTFDGSRAVVTSNAGAPRLAIVDTATHSVINTLPLNGTPRSVAMDPAGALAYVTLGDTNELAIVDVGESAPGVVETIPVGTNPWDVSISPDANRAYVSNSDSASVSVIDLIARQVSHTIEGLETTPQGLALSPDGSELYVAGGARGNVYIIDTQRLEVTANVTVWTEASNQAADVAVSCAGDRVYVSGSDAPVDSQAASVAIIDPALGTVLASLRLSDHNGDGYPDAVASLAACAQQRQPAVFLTPAVQHGQAALGETIVYTMTLLNATGRTERFHLSLTGNRWSATISRSPTDLTPIAQVGPLTDTTSLEFNVRVTIPEDAAWYDEDVVTIMATSAASPTLFADASLLTTEAFAPPQLDVVPTALSVTLPAGQIGTNHLTIRNDGGVTLTFKVEAYAVQPIEESNLPLTDTLSSQPHRGDIDRRPATAAIGSNARRDLAGTQMASRRPGLVTRSNLDAPPRILVYTDDFWTGAGQTYVEQALTRLGLQATVHYADVFQFLSALQEGGPWDLVLVSHNDRFEAGMMWPAVEQYVQNGGRAIIETFDIDGSHSQETTLWETCGVAPAGDFEELTTLPVYWWEPAHPLFTDPESVPPFSTLTALYIDNGDQLGVLEGATALAGYTPDAAPSHAAIVLGAGGRCLVNGFLISGASTDSDRSGHPDGVQLWENEIRLMAAPLLNVPWLHIEPATGTVCTNEHVTVAVIVDTTPLQPPGPYAAQLVIINNAGPSLWIPLDLSVQKTPTMGLVTGRVIDGRTGDELRARVTALGTPYTVMTAPDTAPNPGEYFMWLEAGTYDLEASAPGYQRERASVTVRANDVTSQGFLLYRALYISLVSKNGSSAYGPSNGPEVCQPAAS